MNRRSAGQRIDLQEKQLNMTEAAYDDGRIRCDDQELIIRTWLGSGKLALPGQAR